MLETDYLVPVLLLGVSYTVAILSFFFEFYCLYTFQDKLIVYQCTPE